MTESWSVARNCQLRAMLIELSKRQLGVTRYDPRCDLMCEGRNRLINPSNGLAHQWCGELPSYVLELAGVRDAVMMNRVSTRGSWSPGENITSLQAAAAMLPAKMCLEPGDFVVFNRNAGNHVGIVVEVGAGYFKTIDANSVGHAVALNVRTETPLAIVPPEAAVHGRLLSKAKAATTKAAVQEKDLY